MSHYDDNFVHLRAAVDYATSMVGRPRTYLPPELVDGRVTKEEYGNWVAVMQAIFEKENAASNAALAEAKEWAAICDEDLAEERRALESEKISPETKMTGAVSLSNQTSHANKTNKPT